MHGHPNPLDPVENDRWACHRHRRGRSRPAPARRDCRCLSSLCGAAARPAKVGIGNAKRRRQRRARRWAPCTACSGCTRSTTFGRWQRRGCIRCSPSAAQRSGRRRGCWRRARYCSHFASSYGAEHCRALESWVLVAPLQKLRHGEAGGLYHSRGTRGGSPCREFYIDPVARAQCSLVAHNTRVLKETVGCNGSLERIEPFPCAVKGLARHGRARQGPAIVPDAPADVSNPSRFKSNLTHSSDSRAWPQPARRDGRVRLSW